MPTMTAVIRLVAPSLRMALPKWNSTVFSEIESIVPISQLVLPSLHHFKHSTSFDERRPPLASKLPIPGPSMKKLRTRMKRSALMAPVTAIRAT